MVKVWKLAQGDVAAAGSPVDTNQPSVDSGCFLMYYKDVARSRARQLIQEALARSSRVKSVLGVFACVLVARVRCWPLET